MQQEQLLYGAVYTWWLCVFFLSESYLIMKWEAVNALQNAFKTDINPITQTTSKGGLRQFPDETGQV